MNSDELFEQWEADELADKAELGKMTPIDYARFRGLQPQRVYYYVRNKKLGIQYCECGRKVIVVKEADELFGLGDHADGD